MVTAGRNTRKKNATASTKNTKGKAKRLMDESEKELARAVAERIVRARKEMGLTQVELAELAGVSARSMQGYENAEVVPWRKFNDLARVLNSPVEWLLHGEEAIAPTDVRLAAIEKKLDTILRKLK